MCGIFYLVTQQSKVINEDLINQNINKLQRRGPDNSQIIRNVYRHRIENIVHYIGFHRFQDTIAGCKNGHCS